MEPNELRRWMTSHRWTVERLAARVGVDPSTLSRWRGGQTEPPAMLELALRHLEHLERKADQARRRRSRQGAWTFPGQWSRR